MNSKWNVCPTSFQTQSWGFHFFAKTKAGKYPAPTMRIKQTSAHENMWIYYILIVMNLLPVSEFYNDWNVINSHIFIRTCWFFCYSEASVRGHEIFKICSHLASPAALMKKSVCFQHCHPPLNQSEISVCCGVFGMLEWSQKHHSCIWKYGVRKAWPFHLNSCARLYASLFLWAKFLFKHIKMCFPNTVHHIYF